MTFEPWMSPRQAAEQIANAMYADGKIRDYLVEAVTTACQHFSNEQLERSGDRALRRVAPRPPEAIDGQDNHVNPFHEVVGIFAEVMEMLIAKQAKNFARKWPAIAPEDQAVEHDRSEDQG